MLKPNDEFKTVTMADEMKISAETSTPQASNPPPSQRQPTGRKLPFEMGKKIKVIPETRKGQLNVEFLSTIPGVLKVAEVLVAFIAFILSICAERRSASAGWTEHLCFESMIVVSALIAGYVIFPHLTLGDQRTRDGLIVLELLFYGINTFFFFIAVWLMVHLSASFTFDGRGAAIMTAVLCVALVVLFAMETYIKYKAWRGQEVLTGGGQRKTPNPTQQHSPSVPPAPTQRPQQTTFSIDDKDGQVTV